MARIDIDRIRQASSLHIKPSGFQPTYGTAGFRSEASLLTSTVFRCGLLTAARALLLQQQCGLMITASHNPAADNGVKIVEPTGEMLPTAWEPLATVLAQSSNDAEVASIMEVIAMSPSSAQAQSFSLPSSVLSTIQQVLLTPAASIHSQNSTTALGTYTAQTAAAHGVDSSSNNSSVSVLIGHDTRSSAAVLVAAAQAGVEAMCVAVHHVGLVTTPQLHFAVHAANHGVAVEHSKAAYYDQLLSAYEQLVQGTHSAEELLHVDCANGVGRAALQASAARLKCAGLSLVLHNTGEGQLNHHVGADFVQKDKVPPQGFEGLDASARCCSIDGDADRLVYFVCHGAGRWVELLDGDKIAMLAAVYVHDLLNGLPEDVAAAVKVGVVQTAYANGASTAYITQHLKLEACCTPTGVKYLHEAAHHYDIGIYFEANGHGTVLFAKPFLQKLKELTGNAAARELQLLSKVINQTVGDALSGILMVEAILRRKGWSIEEWRSLYSDLPSRMTKVTVADRSVITTTDAERRCMSPAGLQEGIDELLKEYSQARAFVRPSGTEDAVRVYAEAHTQGQADELAARMSRLVFDKAGGVGLRP